jgi:nucleotide sugar dehydrogenase
LRQRAVITGGAGFLGSHLVERLLEIDIDVLCLDNFLTGAAENVVHLQGRPGFHLQGVDVTEYITVSGPVDFVLHFASPASPIDYAEFPIQTLKVGALGTLNTLDLAKEKGARYLLASTSEVYGDPLIHPQPEGYLGNVNPVGPRACYDEAKRYAEALTSSYRAKHGVDSAIVRIFNTYGPRMRPNDGRAIPTFIRQALRGEALTVAGDGSQTRSMCYVDDLVEGVLRMLFSSLSGPVNLGNPHELSILQVAELVRDIAGSTSTIEFVPRPTDDPSVRRPDIELARTALSWTPAIDVRQGIEQTVAWFRDKLEQAYDDDARTTTAAAAAGRRRQKVAVVGAGYVGAVTATCLAWIGHEVRAVDTDPACSGQLNQGQAPFYEPGLPELLRSALASGRLQFTDQFSEALNDADFIFLCVATPQKLDGTPDLVQLESALRSLGPYLNETSIVINKSTVPVGFGNWSRTILEDGFPRKPRVEYPIVSNPEFLREGSSISDFLHPDRIVLGGEVSAVQRVTELYQPVLAQSFEGGRPNGRPKLITTDLASAEMIKYAANAFLATKISFANEIANLCELLGSDARQVLPAIGADNRIGERFLSPGIGWGGSCFGKDIAALVATGQEYGYSPRLLRAAADVNFTQRAAVLRKLQRELRILKGRRVALLGLAFKPGTDDLRDAPALDIAGSLIAAGSTVSAYDPVVKRLSENFRAVRLASDVYDAATRADAVVLTTEWPEFRHIDVGLLRSVMTGTLLIDGRNFLHEPDFARAGVRLAGFGW